MNQKMAPMMMKQGPGTYVVCVMRQISDRIGGEMSELEPTTRGELIWSGRKCTVFGLFAFVHPIFRLRKKAGDPAGRLFSLVEDELDFYKFPDKSLV